MNRAYHNPVIRGFNPDPSICRVGNEYYLVTSTFEFFPGIPVYKSEDLVNWTQIGNVITRAEDFPYKDARIGRGVWAPTIRFYKGRFYVTAKFQDCGNFIMSAADPAGEWSKPVFVPMTRIDPSLLFDEGKVYYCTNQRDADNRESITLAEIDPDTGGLLTRPAVIWHGVADDRPQHLEAPHVYHIGNWYYLLAAEGGTGWEHMVTAARSGSVWGPYEDCPYVLLTNRHGEDPEVACSGHGDLVEDADGNWWMVHLATRPDDQWYSHLGRETFLLPVRWENGWPVVADGASHLAMEGPLVKEQVLPKGWEADLSRRQPEWLFVRTPEEDCCRFGPEGLRMEKGSCRLDDPAGSPSFIGVRQPDVFCSAEAAMDAGDLRDGEEAGMAVLISAEGHYLFGVHRSGGRLELRARKNGEAGSRFAVPVSGLKFTLRIEASREEYKLFYREEGEKTSESSVTEKAGDRAAGDGADWTFAGSVPVLTRADAGKCFTGTLLGLYAEGRVLFSRFRTKRE